MSKPEWYGELDQIGQSAYRFGHSAGFWLGVRVGLVIGVVLCAIAAWRCL